MQNIESAHILLVCRSGHVDAQALASKIGQWLQAHGHSVISIEAGNDDPVYDLHVKLAVVLGGDGTFLGVCRRLAGKNVPVLAINFGRVGFLAEVQPEQWQEYLSAFLEGRLPQRKCCALWWRLIRKEEVVGSGKAVNDVVLGRNSLSHLISLDVSVGDQRIGRLRGDGLIIATQQGSTGYCFSAGGPLLCPGVKAITFTPICRYSDKISPMVFSCDSVFRLLVESNHPSCIIALDGQEEMSLETGDIVEVGCLPDAVLIMGNNSNFFERLRKRAS